MDQEQYEEGGKVDPLLEGLVENGFSAGDSLQKHLDRHAAEMFLIGVRSVSLELLFLFADPDDETTPVDIELRLVSDEDELLSASLFDLLKEAKSYTETSDEMIAQLFERIARKIRKGAIQ